MTTKLKLPQVIVDLQNEQARIQKELAQKQTEVNDLKKGLQEVLDKISDEIKKI